MIKDRTPTFKGLGEGEGEGEEERKRMRRVSEGDRQNKDSSV